MHQTIDDCGCSVCKWALGSQASEAAWNSFCRLGSDVRLRTAAGNGGSRHYFAALPTAQSCYVMTAAMHGNAPAVAAATSLQTLAAIVTLPIWISLAIL
ncbi:hypothetical protein [Sutterella wadsworthensis]|uniref:hypothetical protein n=1 Tax=Sutterella wadsworthensis TaxID=40545 RepID=UPI00266BC665|nr:hypothetical protein [Sutterella wadsworthensis]